MDPRADLNRNLTIFAISAPAAIAVWLIFHAVYASLVVGEVATGYVDANTKIGIAMGYVAMVGGTLVFGCIALRAAWGAVAAWARLRQSS